MPRALKIQLALLGSDVKAYKVAAGTSIKDFLEQHKITPKGDIRMNNAKAKLGSVLKVDSMIMLVPKVDGN